MAGLFDALMMLTGHQDPSMAIAKGLGQAPGQPGSPAGPVPAAPAPGGPSAAGGAPGAPGGPQGAPPAPPQPQAYTSPPDLAQAYLALSQRDQARQQFNSGLGLMAASAYPGRRPDLIMKAMSSGGEDPNSTFNALFQIHQMNQQQQSLDAFRRSVPDLAQKLNMTQDEVLSLGPQGAAAVMGKIAEAKAGVGGGPAWMAQQRAEQALTAQGKPIPWTPGDPSSYNAYNTAKAAGDVAKAKDVQGFKDSAVEDFSSVDPKFTKNENTVASLLKNMPATMSALQAPDFLTTGKLPGYLPGGGPYDQSVKNAANAMNTLKAELSSEGLRNVKNVRNVREFNTLGSALTNALDASNSPDQVQQALEAIQKGFLDAHATATMAAGKPLSGALVGHGDRAFLDPKSPYYNGATEAAPDDAPAAAGGGAGGGGGALKPMPAATKQAAQALIAKDPSQRAPLIQHLREQGIDPTGL